MTMRFLVRQDDQLVHAGAGDSPQGGLDALRAAGNQMLAVADDAIQRTLTGSDSETFLKATRQQGGQ
jgi:hypothetical protein